MTDSEEMVDLPPEADEVLQNWPDDTRSDADFERMARAVDARISAGYAGSNPPPSVVEGWLFHPPLPLQAGEPRHQPSATSKEQRAPTAVDTGLSLKDIAKAALLASATDAPSAPEARAPLESGTRERDDRISRVNVVALSGARRNAQGKPPAPPASDAALVPALATPAASGSEPNLDRTSAEQPQSTRPGASSTPKRAPARAHWWLWSTLAAAAAVVAYVGTSATPEAGVVAKGAAAPTAVSEAELSAKLAQAPSLPSDEQGSSPGADETPGEEGAAELAPAQGLEARSVAELPSAEKARRSRAVPTAAKAPVAAVQDERAEDTPSVGAESIALEGQADEPQLVPAARPMGTPTRPSIGAAQGAVGSVLGAARACVAGQFSPSKVEVVFGSDGRVQRVGVSGPAKGTPVEACIVSAMRGARVRPFSDETFSVRTTVRP